MTRPTKIDRPVKCMFSIPTSIHAKVEIELFSEVEGCVPKGVKSQLITNLLTEWLMSRGVSV